MNGLSEFLQYNYYIIFMYVIFNQMTPIFPYILILVLAPIAAEYFLIKRLAVGASFFKILMVVIAMNVVVIFIVPFISSRLFPFFVCCKPLQNSNRSFSLCFSQCFVRKYNCKSIF